MSGSRSPFVPYVRQIFRTQRRVTLFWAIGLAIYCGMIVALYPSVRDAIDIDAIPANLRAAFNIDDFTQLATFLSSELLGVIIPIVLPFYGVIMLSNVVAGAEERGRLDILLGNPLPRAHLILGSFLVAAVFLLALIAVLGVVIWAVAQFLDLDLPARSAARAAFAVWPLTLTFSAWALAMSTVVRQRAVALGVPTATIFLMFLLNVIGRLAPEVGEVRYLSAFHYYGSAIIEGYWWMGGAVLMGTTAALVGFAVIAFDRRDLYA